MGLHANHTGWLTIGSKSVNQTPAFIEDVDIAVGVYSGEPSRDMPLKNARGLVGDWIVNVCKNHGATKKEHQYILIPIQLRRSLAAIA